MKWRAVYLKDGSGALNKEVIESDSHTINKILDNLYICFRKQKPQAVIIGRWSTPVLARQCCEEDYPGKEYPPDTHETYPPGRPTLDSQEGPREDATWGASPTPVP